MQLFRISKPFVVLVLLSIGILGFVLILRYQTDTRQRASSDSSQEVENGLISGNAQVGTDSQASGGKYVLFGANTSATQLPFPSNRPLFGTYVDTNKFTSSYQAKQLIITYAKVIYPDGMNWCGPQTWSDPQAIVNTAPGAYIINKSYLDKTLRDPQVLEKGIVARGYVWNAREGDYARPSTLPQDVSSPLYGQAMMKAEVDCTTSVMSAFKDRIQNWRLVNEVFNGDGTRRISWQTNQPVDIKHKITAARSVDQSAQLFIDDYSAEEVNAKSTGILTYLNELKNSGYIMNGIGFQGHFSLKYPPNIQSIRDNIQRFKDAGFDVAFTEVDVAIDGVSGTEDEKRQRQKDIYSSVAQACRDFSNCKYFMLFGMDDNNSWLGPDALATPFDLSFQPKPAFAGLQQVLGL